MGNSFFQFSVRQSLTVPCFFDKIVGITLTLKSILNFKESEENNGYNYRRRNHI